jgi:hypothetical protein
MEMKSLSVKCVPSKRLLMLLVWQTAVYFNYNIQNCNRSIQTSNTVRQKYCFVQSTYSQNTQNIVLYKALTVKRHKIPFCTKHLQSKHTKYRFVQSTYSQKTQNIVLYKALTVKTHKISFCTKHLQSKHTNLWQWC